MKKVFAVLAVLAVAAAAQADMLATWGTGGELTTWGDSMYDVTDITASGGASLTTTGTFGVNNMNTGGGFEFTYLMDDGYTGITGATVDFSANGSTTGPKQLDWYVDNSFVSSISRTTSSTTAYSAQLGDLPGTATVKMLANVDAGAVKDGATFGSGGSLNMRSDVVFNGTPVEGTPGQVPEPATMSLLGLGALAMALRRKLRK